MSAPMVRAMLDGSKTQTRRAMRPQPFAGGYYQGDICFDGFRVSRDSSDVPRAKFSTEAVGGGAYMNEEFRCPYGQPGDRLWVRETYFAFGRWETRYSEKKGRDEWHFIDMTIECDRAYQYASDNPDVPLAKDRGILPGWWKRPAIFMPRVATLQVGLCKEATLSSAMPRDVATALWTSTTRCGNPLTALVPGPQTLGYG